VGVANLLHQRFCTRRRVGDSQRGVVRVHRERARENHFADEIASLLQHGVDVRPVHGQQQRIRMQSGLTRCASPRVPLRLSSESLQLSLAARLAEDYVVSCPREDRPELAAHQSATDDTDAQSRTSA